MPAVIELHHQRVAEPIDDQPRQAVGLGVDQAVAGPVEQPLAQLQGAGDAPGDEAASISASLLRVSRRAAISEVRG